MTAEPSKIRRWLVPTLKLVVLTVVALFIVKYLIGAFEKLRAENFSLADVRPGWLVVSGVLFLLSQLPMAWFWHKALEKLGQRPTLWHSLRAYMIGGLGKYVPGKAMVVVLRSGMVRSKNVDVTVATLCVFIETLTMMAVGGFVAAVLLLAGAVEVPLRTSNIEHSTSNVEREASADASPLSFNNGGPAIYLVAIGLMLATGLPTLPPIFRRVVRVLRVSKAKADIDVLLERLDYKLMACGWIANLIAWPLMGLSLWATLRAMPGTESSLGGVVESLPLMTASIALATIAGFVSMVPGGFGVRELVLNVLLVPTFGKLAILSVILLRLVWLVSELVVSSILYVSGKVCCDASPALSDAAPADTK